MKSTPAQLSDSLCDRLGIYALAATAAGAGFAVSAQPAEAKVVYTPADQIIFKTLSLDLNHDGAADFLFTHRSHYARGFQCTVSAGPNSQNVQDKIFGNQVITFPEGETAVAANALAAGLTVGPARGGNTAEGSKLLARFASVIGTGTGSYRSNFGLWQNHGKGVTDRYLGLTFTIQGQTHFGWARLSTGGFGGCVARLTGYAYETVPNKSILTGQTSDNATNAENLVRPGIEERTEAPTLGALAIGFPGLALWKREGNGASAVPAPSTTD